MPPLVCGGQERRHRVGTEVPVKTITRFVRRVVRALVKPELELGPTGNPVVDQMFGKRR